MCFKSATVDSRDKVLLSKQAQLAGELFKDHQQRFVPRVERPLLDYIDDDSQPLVEAERAKGEAGKRFDIGSGIADRNFRRMGVNLTKNQRDSLESRRKLAKTSSGVAEATRGYEQTKDYQKGLRTSAIQLGRGIDAAASSNLNAAAGIEAGRAQRNAQAKANAHNSLVNTALTVGGAAVVASDKNKKKNRKKMPEGKALKQVRGMPVETWEYKKGAGPSGKHVGPMYQNSPDRIKAKGKKAIDLHDELQMGMAAIQDLANKVDRIERGLSK